MKERAVKIRISREEVIVKGSDAREMKEGATAAVRRLAVGVAGMLVKMGGGGEIETGEEGFQGGVAVDERREVVRGALNVGTEGEEKG